MIGVIFSLAALVYLLSALVFSRLSPLTVDRIGQALFAAKTLIALALAAIAVDCRPVTLWLWLAYVAVTAAWRLRGVQSLIRAGAPARGVARALRRLDPNHKG